MADVELYQPAVTERANQFAHPVSGELLDLARAEDLELAALLEDLDRTRDAIQDAKRIVSDEALRRMDRLVHYTLHAGPYELTGRSPEPSIAYGDHRRIEYDDGHDLLHDLLELVNEDVLDRRAVEAAVEPVVAWKIKTGAVKKLRKLGGRVADVIDNHAREVHKPRYVRWERSR